MMFQAVLLKYMQASQPSLIAKFYLLRMWGPRGAPKCRLCIVHKSDNAPTMQIWLVVLNLGNPGPSKMQTMLAIPLSNFQEGLLNGSCTDVGLQ